MSLFHRFMHNIMNHMLSQKGQFERNERPSNMLYIVAGLHILISALIVVYPLFTTFAPRWKRFDGFYIIAVGAIVSHWLLFRGECILSYIEKRCFYRNYKMGAAPVHIWEIDVIPTALVLKIILALFSMFYIAVSWTILRNIKPTARKWALHIVFSMPLGAKHTFKYALGTALTCP
jgi:hypothetical protein